MINKHGVQRSVPEEAKLSRWDAADYLEDLEDIVYYLEAAFHEGDPRLITAALGDVARAKGMTDIAGKTGLGRENLYKALSSSGNPKFTTIVSVLKSLGIRLQPTLLDYFDPQDEVNDACLLERSNIVIRLIAIRH